MVDAAWLRHRMGTPELVIADCRFRLAEPDAGRRLYGAGHIPGAVFIDVGRDLSDPPGYHGGRHPLPPPHRLAARLGSLGIGDATTVVAYDDDGAFAPRLWWLLRYLGHTEVAVLDGGLPAWAAAGGPLIRTEADLRPRRFTARPQRDMVVDAAAVRDRQEGTVLIDVRAPQRYRGEVEPLDPVPGRIPGAVNMPHDEGRDASGHWLDPAAQRRRLPLATPDTPAIVYCGSGLTACAGLLALELAGVRHARLYAGSYSDWCSYADHPVERG